MRAICREKKEGGNPEFILREAGNLRKKGEEGNPPLGSGIYLRRGKEKGRRATCEMGRREEFLLGDEGNPQKGRKEEKRVVGVLGAGARAGGAAPPPARLPCDGAAPPCRA